MYLNETKVKVKGYENIYLSPCVSCEGCELKMIKEIEALPTAEKGRSLVIFCNAEKMGRKMLSVHRSLDDEVLPTYNISQGLPLKMTLSEGRLEKLRVYEAE